MAKKTKKILMAAGALTTIIAPVATVIGCGSSSHSSSNIIIDSFINNGEPTLKISDDDMYDYLVNKRVADYDGNGAEVFGLWDGVDNVKDYQYGLISDSIGYNYNFLQNGKLFMAAYYHKNRPANGDMRTPLTRLGDLLQASLKILVNKGFDHVELLADKDKITNVLKSFKLDDVLLSKPKDLVNLDYLGFKGLAQIFNQEKFKNAASDSNEAKTKTNLSNWFNQWFNDFQYQLSVDMNNHTVKENEALAYAYDEVIGYSWDILGGALGDRKNPSPTLLKNWIGIPHSPDHNITIGDYIIKDGHKKEIQIDSASQDGKQPYSGHLYRFSGTKNMPYNTQLAESNNDTLAKGIIVVNVGSGRYGSKAELTEGEATRQVLKFGLFDKISLLDSNGHKIKAFTTDEYKGSIPDTSINSKVFKDSLNNVNLKSFKFHVKDGQKWTGSNGNKTSHSVTAEDFWYSLMRSNYGGVGVRNTVDAAGGSMLPATGDNGPTNDLIQKIEKIFTSDQKNKADGLVPPSKQDSQSKPFYEASYFTNTYGMKAINEASHDSVIDKANNNITFELNAPAPSKASLFFKDFFGKINTNNLIAVPSEKIKSQLSSFTTRDEFKNLHIDTTKPVFKYGVYYENLLQNLNEMEFAGRYYPSQINDQSVVYTKNNNYRHEAFVDFDHAPSSHTYRYIDIATNYSEVIKKDYEGDAIYSVGFDKKLSEWKNEILQKSEQEQKAFGLTYTKAATSTKDTGERFFTYALPFSTKHPEETNYYFSEDFAKVMYGSTIKELYNANDITRLAETLYHGTGLEFRSSIQTIMNSYAVAHNFSPGTQQNNAHFGPEALIPGNDINSNNPLSVYSSKVFNRVGFGKHLVEVTKEQYRSDLILAEGDRAFLLMGNKFNQLRENIVDALNTAGVKNAGSVISELPLNYRGGITGVEYGKYLESMRYAYNHIDNRIHFVAQLRPTQRVK